MLNPSEYDKAPVYDLLVAAARGHVGIDHRWLKAILKRGAAAAPDLLAFLTTERKEDRFELDEDVLAIARALACPEMVPVLVELARRYTADFPDLLRDAFRLIGAPAVEPLIKLREELEDPIELDGVLASLGVRDARILNFLLEDLERDPVSGAIHLSIYGDAAALPALRKLLAGNLDHEAREIVLNVLERLTKQQSCHPEPVAEFDIWSWYPEQAGPEVEHLSDEELYQLARSPEPDWRIDAIEELATRATEKPEIPPRLLEMAREDPDPRVRGACWRALRRTGIPGEWNQLMLQRLADARVPQEERRGILIGLSEHAEDAAVRRWILDFYDRPETRAVALEAMKFSANPHFAPYVREHLGDEDPEVRRQAVLAAAALGMRGELARLEKLLRDPAVREEALVAYATLAPAEPNAFSLRRLLRKIEQLAGGLSDAEARLVQTAFDERMFASGHPPYNVLPPEEHAKEDIARPRRPGRNDPCPCGSGKKYKKCCGAWAR